MELKMKRGFNLGLMSGIALGLVILVVVTVVGATILGKLKTQTSDTNASRVATTGLQSMEDFSGWFGIVVVVAVGAFVIYLLQSSFGGER